MKKSDFRFYKKDNEYEDYWFYIDGETQDELTDRHMEQSMVSVTEVVYSKVDDIVAVRKLFPFNTMVVYDKNPELRKILLELVQVVDKECREVKRSECVVRDHGNLAPYENNGTCRGNRAKMNLYEDAIDDECS